MTPSWTALLLSAALTIVLALLWHQARRRTRARVRTDAKVAPEGAQTLAPDVALTSAPDDPPALHSVREALAEARAEQAEQAEQVRRQQPANPPEAAAPEPEPLAEQGADPEAERAAAPEEEAKEPEQAPLQDPGTSDRFDDHGRLVLVVAMGDAIAPAELPRRLELTVRKQWPLPVVHGFDAERERLVLYYDGAEPNDVVFLPTVEGTWQISLGGRPVIRVSCAQGPEGLAAALRINP